MYNSNSTNTNRRHPRRCQRSHWVQTTVGSGGRTGGPQAGQPPPTFACSGPSTPGRTWVSPGGPLGSAWRPRRTAPSPGASGPGVRGPSPPPRRYTRGPVAWVATVCPSSSSTTSFSSSADPSFIKARAGFRARLAGLGAWESANRSAGVRTLRPLRVRVPSTSGGAADSSAAAASGPHMSVTTHWPLVRHVCPSRNKTLCACVRGGGGCFYAIREEKF